MNEQALPLEIRDALAAYRQDRTPERWTDLSQVFVYDDVDVLDALQTVHPDFPDPLPLPIEGVVEDNAELFQWSVLPDPDDVLRAILVVLDRK